LYVFTFYFLIVSFVVMVVEGIRSRVEADSGEILFGKSSSTGRHISDWNRT